MERRRVEEMAFNYHNSGFHCAEAVAKAIMESFCIQQSAEVPRVVSAFGGGIGRSHQDLCGALAGGVAALGLVMGRNQPGESWLVCAEAAAELRRRFLGRCGTTNCAQLLERLGKQENMLKCKKLSGQVAGMVWDILQKPQGQAPSA